MSNCFKELYDYDSVKNCYKCKKISLKSKFSKDRSKKDGYRPECKVCCKKYYQNRRLNNHKNL